MLVAYVHPGCLVFVRVHVHPVYAVDPHPHLYISHRCSVQRIARRSGVLDEQRVAQLDSIGFDWTGADALS